MKKNIYVGITFFHDFFFKFQSTLIIMLTTIVERGRIKCHKYWPDVGDTIGKMEA